MANPQVEDGHLRIANGLVVAITRAPLKATEFRVLLALMNMTYNVGKTKSEISTDDFRYATNLKKYQVDQALEGLLAAKIIFKQQLVDGDTIYGVQKDYDRWWGTELPQSSTVLRTVLYKNKDITDSMSLPQSSTGASPPDKLLNFVLAEMQLKPGLGRWKRERKSAVELYKLALELLHEPQAAVFAIRDHFEAVADTNFRSRVTMPMGYMLTSFPSWIRQVPKKTRSVRSDEEITGYRYRYDVAKERWVRSADKLARPGSN